MNYTEVTSSQIAAIGYDPETRTLGIQFPPNRKQVAAGLPRSEYRYANVGPKMYAEFMAAESIGSYFGKNIKSHPELYPYTKVESENPIPPQTKIRANGSGETTTNSESLDQPETLPETSASETSTALAVIDTLAPEVIFAPGNVDSILVKLREQVLAMAKGLDPSTPAKQKRIRDVKGLVASQRIFVEKARKGYVADLVAKKGLTDKVSSAIQGRLSDIEGEILEVTGYAAWEQGEKEFESRMDGLKNRLANMGKEMHLYTSCAAIEAAIKELEEFDTSETREHKQAVELAIDNSLRVLKPELARRQEAEHNAAELAELRRKQAEREEADQQAEAKRQEQERIDAAVQEKLDAAIEAAKVEIRQEVIAELAEPVNEIPPSWKLDMIAPHPAPDYLDCTSPKFEASTSSGYSPSPFTPRETPSQFPTSNTRNQSIHAEVVEALAGYDCSTRHGRIRLTQAIVDGLIPHVSLAY